MIPSSILSRVTYILMVNFKDVWKIYSSPSWHISYISSIFYFKLFIFYFALGQAFSVWKETISLDTNLEYRVIARYQQSSILYWFLTSDIIYYYTDNSSVHIYWYNGKYNSEREMWKI